MLDTRLAPDAAPFRAFEAALRAPADPRAALAAGLIGKSATVPGPFGPRPMLYADYVASGRALGQVEDFLRDAVLPYYANSHTVDSFCGATMTAMREAGRALILEKCRATPGEHAAIFTGAGATAALNALVHLLGVAPLRAAGGRVTVLTGPFEHHSNLLPWRESGARVIEIDEAAAGGIDLDHLERALGEAAAADLVICAFSAASNVTGVVSDVAEVTRLANRHGAKMVWDYAGGGPYLPIDMNPEGARIDAIALSPHKFIGGPGASGVLVVRRDAVRATTPTRPGGGTVAFVNGETHDYLDRLEEREEGGTPNIPGDIRAALVFVVKDVLGEDWIAARNAALTARAFAAWAPHPAIRVLGADRRARLPILSFVIESGQDAFDHALFTRALSDLHGIQARGGCACAGPYVHRLLDIDAARSAALRAEIRAGDTSGKPGFVRLNLSVLMSEAEVARILDAVAELAGRYPDLAAIYDNVRAGARPA